MTKIKFYSCKTKEGDKMINISNIASIENIDNETVITLKVKKDKETNVSFIVNDSWTSATRNIESLIIQQNLQ